MKKFILFGFIVGLFTSCTAQNFCCDDENCTCNTGSCACLACNPVQVKVFQAKSK